LKIFAPNFVCLFSGVVAINVLLFSEITLRIRNYHEVKLEVRILQLHIVVCYVMLRSEQLLPNLLKKWKLTSVKLICKRTHVHGLSLDRKNF